MGAGADKRPKCREGSGWFWELGLPLPVAFDLLPSTAERRLARPETGNRRRPAAVDAGQSCRSSINLSQRELMRHRQGLPVLPPRLADGPDIWPLEVINILLVVERRKRIAKAAVEI